MLLVKKTAWRKTAKVIDKMTLLSGIMGIDKTLIKGSKNVTILRGMSMSYKELSIALKQLLFGKLLLMPFRKTSFPTFHHLDNAYLIAHFRTAVLFIYAPVFFRETVLQRILIERGSKKVKKGQSES